MTDLIGLSKAASTKGIGASSKSKEVKGGSTMQQKRIKALHNSGEVLKGKSMLVAAIMDIITSSCDNIVLLEIYLEKEAMPMFLIL